MTFELETVDLGMEPRSTVPDRRVSLTLMLTVTLAACLAYGAALYADVLPSRGMAVVFFAITPVFAAFALVVLLTQARAERDPALGWTVAGLTLGVVAMVLQLVSFPVVDPAGGPLGTSDQASAALYLLFHLAFVAGALAGALNTPPRFQVPSVLVGVLVALLVATNSLPLPVLLRDGTVFSPLLIWLEIGLVVLTSGALLVWVARVGGSAPAPHGWVAVALSLSLYDVLLNALGSERFSAVWWASLSFRVATYLVLSLGVLSAVLTRWRDIASHTEGELERREQQLRSSLSVTAGLLSSAEDLSRAIRSEEVGDVLSARARSVTGVHYASVVVGRTGESLRLLGADGYDEAARETLRSIDWDLLLPATYVVSMGTPLFLEQAAQIRERFPDVAGLPVAAASSLAALPIIVRGQPIGVLTVWSLTPHAWSNHQRRVLAGLAVQGGQAIARAQAYEQADAAARTLQESLLPARLPSPARLDLAARYLPAVDTQLVGGDWYDCLVIDEDRVALVVGDVMGKGLRAAAQMGQIRTAVRTLARLDPSPAAVLTALDDLNLEMSDDEIVTLVYVLVDTATGTALIARAGHLPPALVRPGAASVFIETAGSTPLGIANGARHEAAFAMPSGSLLVLYTDGLVEDRTTGLKPGLSRLAASLSTDLPTTAALAEHLLTVSHGHTGQDDIALLVAHYT